MRWTPRTVATAAAVAALSLSGCAGDDPDGRTGLGRSICTTADGEGPRVGLAYDVGGRGDHDLDDGAYAGLVAAVDEVDATCAETEARRDGPASDRVDRLRRLAVEGYDPVIAVGEAYVDATAELAPEFPDTSFAVVGVGEGVAEPAGNVAHLAFAEAEGSHLVGTAAAVESTTGRIGVVGLVTTPRDVVDGFREGARAVEQGMVVRVRLVERRRGLAAATTDMLHRDVDVVYDVSGLAGSSVARVVDAAGAARVIGFGSDLRETLPQGQQDAVLTSMLRRADSATLAVVRGVAEGQPVTGRHVLGVADDGVGWATSGALSTEVTEALEAAVDRLESRSVTAR